MQLLEDVKSPLKDAWTNWRAIKIYQPHITEVLMIFLPFGFSQYDLNDLKFHLNVRLRLDLHHG